MAGKKLDMDAMMKECMKPHALMHLLTGFSLGLIAIGLWPSLGTMALILGVVLLVIGVVGDIMVQKGMV